MFAAKNQGKNWINVWKSREVYIKALASLRTKRRKKAGACRLRRYSAYILFRFHEQKTSFQ